MVKNFHELCRLVSVLEEPQMTYFLRSRRDVFFLRVRMLPWITLDGTYRDTPRVMRVVRCHLASWQQKHFGPANVQRHITAQDVAAAFFTTDAKWQQ